MKFPVLLCIVVTVHSIESVQVAFPVNLLQPDLQVISKYYQKGDNEAYIYWPTGITFKVTANYEGTGADKYLKINGNFQTKRFFIFSRNFKGLYFKNDDFYVLKSNAQPAQKISLLKTVYYTQPVTMTEAQTHLSIRYFSLDEMQHDVDEFYQGQKLHFEVVLYDHPATFLATSPKYDGHFLEYSFLSKKPVRDKSDAKLRVLIGKGSKSAVKLSAGIEAPRLVFDQKKHVFKVPKSSTSTLQNVFGMSTLRNVFGVRMLNGAFLAKVVGKKVEMISPQNLDLDSSVSVISEDELLAKVQAVEPRYSYPGTRFSKEAWPRDVRFQIRGNVLVKSINWNISGYSTVCPFVITYEEEGKMFWFRGRWEKKLCTNNELWAP